jgi:hypothetical protein
MRYYEILFEDFKTAKQKFLDNGVDDYDIDNVFNEYKKFRIRMNPPYNNIDWWARNSDFASLKTYVRDISGIPSSREMKKSKTGKTIILMENEKWLIVIPLDKDASCFHGRETDWCTTKPFQNYYEQYFYKSEITLIYCLDKKSGNKWAIAAHSDISEREFFDRSDNSISSDDFKKQTGLDPDEIISRATGVDNLATIGSSRDYYKSLINRFNSIYNDGSIGYGKNNLEAEKILLYIKDSNRIEKYFQTVGRSSEYNINLQKVAVNLEPYLIQFIKNPEKSVVMMALKSDGYSITYIKDQDEEMKKLAVSTNPHSIRNIKEPISEEIQLMAVSKVGTLIQYINNPSERVQLVAVSNINERHNIDKIPLDYILGLYSGTNTITDRKIIMTSIENVPYQSIDSLINHKISIDEEMAILALSSTINYAPQILRLLRDEGIELTIPIQIEAVANDPYHSMIALFPIFNEIDERVQLRAAKTNGYNFINAYSRISFDQKPTPRAIEEAFKTGWLIEKTIDKVLRAKIKPTYQAFKNAIDNAPEDNNSVIIYILEKSFTFNDIHDNLVEYAEQKAIKDDNKMLMNLIKEYKKNLNLDDLDFEPLD